MLRNTSRGDGSLASAALVVLALCPPPAAAQVQQGARSLPVVIQGIVLDAADGTPLAAANVQLRGEDGERFAGSTTDRVGGFSMSTEATGTVQLTVDRIGYLHGEEVVELVPGDSVFVEFRLESSAILMDPLLVTGQAEARPARCTNQLVVGRLLDDETGEPVVGGRVHLLDEDLAAIRSVRTREEGDFALVTPSPGTYRLRAEGPGYHASDTPELHLIPGDTVHLAFHLSIRRPIGMPIVVTASARRWSDRYAIPEQERLFARMAECHDPDPGWPIRDTFLDRNDIAPWDGTDRIGQMLGDLIPFAMHGPLAFGRCNARLFVDGFPAPQGVTIDTYAPEEIEAVEVYGGPRVPEEYEWDPYTCAVVVLWTRFPEGVPTHAPTPRRLLIGLGLMLLGFLLY